MAEGFVPFRGYRTWYRVVGEGEEPGKLPLLCLHGGPGGTHDYIEPLEGMAATGRRTIFYDQLGCGRSDLPDDPSLWTVELFVEEVGAVREALGLERVHLFGNSWGGMLAMEYALTQPAGLASLVLASAPASIPQWIEETGRLRAQLPAEVQAVLDRYERAGTTDDPEYADAAMVFNRRHVCRVDPWPDCVVRSFDFIERHGVVYKTMNGPSEFHVTGTLREWSVVDRLGEIDVPTLVMWGEQDRLVHPSTARAWADGIAGARTLTYPEAGHMPMLELPRRTAADYRAFLARISARP